MLELLTLRFDWAVISTGVSDLAAIRGRSQTRKTWIRLAHVAAGYVGAALLLFVATGFPIWACLAAARENGLDLIRRAAGAEPGSLWARGPCSTVGSARRGRSRCSY